MIAVSVAIYELSSGQIVGFLKGAFDALALNVNPETHGLVLIDENRNYSHVDTSGQYPVPVEALFEDPVPKVEYEEIAIEQ